MNNHWTKARFFIFFIFLVTFCVSVQPLLAANEKPKVFSTWDDFEVDKCASIWLIKRFINQEAVIQFVPKGDVLKKGIPFDVPDAKLRRYHNRSTFESIVAEYHLKDPRLTKLGQIVHDIEINYWGEKVFPESNQVKDDVSRITSSGDQDQIVKECQDYFDAFYAARAEELNHKR